GGDDRPRGVFDQSNQDSEFLIQVSKYGGLDVEDLKDKSIGARYDLMLSFVKDMERRRKEAEKQ
ncbi:unnamed protein product, partial [marine sediment metagenome]